MPSTSKVNENLPNHSRPEEQVQNDVEDSQANGVTYEISQEEFEFVKDIAHQQSLIDEFDVDEFDVYLNETANK